MSLAIPAHKSGAGAPEYAKEVLGEQVPPAEPRTEQVMRPRNAFYAASEMVSLDDAPVRIAAEFVTPYPPGIPLFVPAERITAEIVAGTSD